MGKWLRFAQVALYFYPLDRRKSPVEDQDNVTVSFIDKTSTEEDIGPLSSLLDPFLIRDRLVKGEICCATFRNREVLSLCWMTFHEKEVGELERLVRPAEGDIYLYQAYTVPKFRGKNLYVILLTHIIQFAKERGYKRLLIFSLAHNRFSRKGIAKAGFSHFQTIFFFRFFKRRLYLSRTLGRHGQSVALESR